MLRSITLEQKQSERNTSKAAVESEEKEAEWKIEKEETGGE